MTTNLEIAQKIYGPGGRLFDHLAEDVVWVETAGFPYGGTYTGAKEIVAGVFSHIQKDWDDFAANAEDYVASGDRVVVFGHYSGTAKATGKTMRSTFAHDYTFTDGKVTRFVQYADSTTFNTALQAD